MGVGPPRNDDVQTPERIEFGIAAVAARLDEADLDFPARAEEVSRAIGHEEIPYDARGNAIAIEDALAETGQRRFDSRNELLNELHPTLESYRTDGHESLLGRIRGLLPF